MDLNKYIYYKATQAGICQEWAPDIAHATGVDDLLKMYVSGIDFCLKNNFPSNTDLVRLGGDKIASYGIYVDAELNADNLPFVVLLGASKSQLTLSGYTSSQIFLKHESTASIQVADNAFVVIDCFDNAKLDITAGDNSKVLINVYGNAKVSHQADGQAIIKIVHKHKSTY